MNDQPFISQDDPENPGWRTWQMAVDGLYNSFLGKIIMRRDRDDALVRMTPEIEHSNLGGVMHGGAMLGFIDVSLFAAMDILSDNAPGYAVTIDLQTQFTSGAKLHQPITARVSVSRETGSLLFMRGLVEQNDQSVAAYTGLIKKAHPS